MEILGAILMCLGAVGPVIGFAWFSIKPFALQPLWFVFGGVVLMVIGRAFVS